MLKCVAKTTRSPAHIADTRSFPGAHAYTRSANGILHIRRRYSMCSMVTSEPFEDLEIDETIVLFGGDGEE